MRLIFLAAALIALSFATGVAMATEEAPFSVVTKDGDFEVRDYASQIVAEVLVDDDFEDAGNAAFRKLFGYISGDNQAREDIAMTSPVAQRERGEKIAMTSPVGQRATSAGWAVSFMMPSGFTLETTPAPTDPAVFIREIPAQRMATVRYSGRWTKAKKSRTSTTYLVPNRGYPGFSSRLFVRAFRVFTTGKWRHPGESHSQVINRYSLGKRKITSPRGL